MRTSLAQGKVVAIAMVALCLCMPVHAQNAHAQNGRGFVVPEWKSSNEQIRLRVRARAIHDFYAISRDFEGTQNDTDISSDRLRAIRFGVDGQLSSTIRVRADANLTNSQINWSDVFLGHVDPKFEAYIGQHYLSANLESVSRPVNALLPTPSLVTQAFDQNVRNFGVVARVKGANWQIIGGVFHGNINAGDIFGDDVQRYAQVRATYVMRQSENTLVHLGVNFRIRDAQNGPLLRYAARPASMSFGERPLDSGFVARGDTTLAFETIIMRGPVVIIGEHHWLSADVSGGSATLAGGYLEANWWLTGEGRRYSASSGNLNQIRPKRSVVAGGYGAIGLVARLDHVDQTDVRLGAGSGRVTALSMGVSWVPVDYVTFRLATSLSRYRGAGPFGNSDARVLMGRAQFSF